MRFASSGDAMTVPEVNLELRFIRVHRNKRETLVDFNVDFFEEIALLRVTRV